MHRYKKKTQKKPKMPFKNKYIFHVIGSYSGIMAVSRQRGVNKGASSYRGTSMMERNVYHTEYRFQIKLQPFHITSSFPFPAGLSAE